MTTVVAFAALQGTCRIGTDFAVLEAELDGDVVGLAAQALLAAGQDFENEVGRKPVGDDPARDGNALTLKFGAGVVGGT